RGNVAESHATPSRGTDRRRSGCTHSRICSIVGTRKGRSAMNNPDTTTTAAVPQEQQEVEAALTKTVLASFADTDDPRLKEVMKSLVTHLHDFIRDVRLTEEEWNAAIEFLTAVGHITDDKRQEFILLSDVLGASMQTINVNNATYKDATEATVFGP